MALPPRLRSRCTWATPAKSNARAIDAVGLANLLYAALTARWPGRAVDSALPPAPYTEGHLRTPRQVRGGVPREVDEVVAQALGDETLLRGLPEIVSPAEFATALAPLRTTIDDAHPYGADTGPDRRPRDPPGPLGQHPPRPCPGVAALGRRDRGVVARSRGRGLAGRRKARLPELRSRRRAGRADSNVYGHAEDHIECGRRRHGPSGRHRARSGHRVRPIRQARRSARVRRLRAPSTAARRRRGGPRSIEPPTSASSSQGSGLLMDLGTAAEGIGGTSRARRQRHIGRAVRERLGADHEKAMTLAAAQVGAPSDVTLRLATPTAARYWVVWLTKLPPSGPDFRGASPK